MALGPPSTRRALLHAAGATLTSVPLAGCAGLLGSTDGTRTPTLTPAPVPQKQVAVGPDGDLVFEPATLQGPPGTTVIWTWESDFHNIEVNQTPEDVEWEGHARIESEGFVYEHTFEVEGTYWYYCSPHIHAGMTGQILITKTPVTTTPTHPDYYRTATPQGTRPPGVFIDARGQTEVTVTVGPIGELIFDPEAVRISTGTTVTWVWDSDNHNIVVGGQPPEADWEGHEPIEKEGFTYTHTFTVAGLFEYWCQPHQSAGMEGTIIVD